MDTRQHIEYWPLIKLRPYEKNPRKNEHAVAKAADLIKTYGFRVPILAKSDGEIIDGHLRYKAAKLLGMDEVPVVPSDDMTEAELKAFRIAVNRMAEFANWDYDLLKAEIGDLKDLAFDVKLTGLSDIKISKLDKALRGEERQRPATVNCASLEDIAPTAEEYKELSGKKFIMSYSGGMDSSSVALWVRHFFPDADMELVFVDLGADFIGFIDHLRAFAQAVGAKLVVLRSTENIIDMFYRRGDWPSFVNPYCHEPMHEAMGVYFKTFHPSNIVLLRGGRRAEKKSSAKAQETRWMEAESLPGYRFFQPLYFADKGSSDRIVRASTAPIWSGYDKGLCRTACRICPGQRPRAYAAMRREYPDVWAELLELERELGPGAWNRSFAGLGVIPSFTESADRGDRELSGEADETADIKPAPSE